MSAAPVMSTAGVPEITGLLFPNLPNFIAHALATIVIIVVLAKFMYKPFRQAVDERRAKINELLDEAIDKQTAANKAKREAETLLASAKTESLSIVNIARSDAETRRTQILHAATAEAANIQVHAKNMADREMVKAEESVKKTIVDVAFLAAAQILEREIDKEKNAALVEDFIANLDLTKQGESS